MEAGERECSPFLFGAVQISKVMDIAKNPAKGLFPPRPKMESKMAIFGYARVSTDGQTLDSQLEALTAAGAVKVFSEKESGLKTDRKALAKALAVLDKGDVLLVTRLDRLARSTLDLLNTLEQVTKRKAGFRSLADTWADTTTAHGKLMITILGGLAEFERTLILARTNEGRQRAIAKGVKFGRKPKLTEYQIDEAKRRLEAGASQSEVGRLFGVSHQTIGRL
jgi:DNA invertase Pin-like site-specific DNA recombinase